MYHLKNAAFNAFNAYLRADAPTNNQIDPYDRVAYLASQSAYGDEKSIQALKEQGYTVESKKDNYTIFSHPTEKGVIAFRGTKTPRDLYSDLNVAYNLPYDQRFVEARQLAEKYPDYLLTGHSLGGSLAIDAAKKSKNESVVFNPGSSMYGLNYGQTKVYKSSNDPISDRLIGDKPIYSAKGDHSLSTFDFLNDS
jgi:hypothetical protein